MRVAGKVVFVGLNEPMRHAWRRMLSAPAVALAVVVVLAVSLAGCGSSGSASSPGTVASSSLAVGGTASAATASFVSILEPFDPGHPARAESAPAHCGGQSTAIEIEQCYQAKTENVDAQIDVAQSATYSSAAPAERKTILAQDSAWLAARAPVCAAAFSTGGTIDGISAAACLLDESSARLAAVKGIAPPEARLQGTDSTDPNQLSWYTTPEGSRIAEISTQGDRSRRARAVNPVLLPRPDRQEVRVRHRLLQAGQGPECRQERRGVPLRAGRSGRGLGVAPRARSCPGARPAALRCA
jgi:uncharacterized protein YecT (DUF1311 family)